MIHVAEFQSGQLWLLGGWRAGAGGVHGEGGCGVVAAEHGHCGELVGVLCVEEGWQGGLAAEHGFLAVLEGFMVALDALAFLVFDGLVDLDANDLVESAINLALAVAGETAVAVGDVVPEEEKVEEHGEEQAQGSEDPDDEREDHAGQDDSLFLVPVGKDTKVLEELEDRRRSILVLGVELGDVHFPQRQGVDDLSRSRAEDDTDPRLEREVREQRHVLGTLLTLRQLREDQEALPATTLAKDANGLESDSQGVEVTLSHGAAFDNEMRTDVLVDDIDPRRNDAAGENPFRDV